MLYGVDGACNIVLELEWSAFNMKNVWWGILTLEPCWQNLPFVFL